MRVPFRKMHGCGNDFVVFDDRSGALGFTPARAAALADRRTGIGCDQFIVIEAPPPGSGRPAIQWSAYIRRMHSASRWPLLPNRWAGRPRL